MHRCSTMSAMHKCVGRAWGCLSSRRSVVMHKPSDTSQKSMRKSEIVAEICGWKTKVHRGVVAFRGPSRWLGSEQMVLPRPHAS